MGYLTALFISTTVQLNLPPNLLSSVCYIETRHNVSKIHRHDGDSDSIGICQIKLKTAKWLGYKGDAKGLLDPKVNIYYAGKYLKYHMNRHNNVSKAVIAYNQGHVGKAQFTSYQIKVFKQWRLALNE